MVRFFLGSAALCALVACAPPIPDSGAGFDSAAAQRDADLARSPTQPGLSAPQPVQSTGLDPAGQPLPSSVTSAVNGPDAQLEANAAAAAAAANSGVAPLNASPSNPAPAQVNSAGISSEQDFDTVSSARSIESDAQRIAANRQLYRVVQPTELPQRPGSNQPNIVAFALQTNHPVGAQLYKRSGFRSESRHQSACARFASADQAQIEFLSQGGPDRDRRTLDPDGDGYACSWDPSPFRNARNAAPQPTGRIATPSSVNPAPTETTAAASASTIPAPGVSVPSSAIEPLVISSE